MARQPPANNTHEEIDFIFDQEKISLPERTPDGPAPGDNIAEWIGGHIQDHRRVSKEQVTLDASAQTQGLPQGALGEEQQRLSAEFETIEAKINGGIREGLSQKCKEALLRYACLPICEYRF
jgi:hypothetical protein